MPDRPIYLFKTARRPLYRKENLNLLAAERGTVHEYAWNRSWVSPEYFDDGAIRRGTRVFFLFTERPFDRFVPVRDGQVVAAEWDETLLRVKVLLNNPVGVREMDLDTFTHLVKKTSKDGAPPTKFVAPKADGVELVTLYDDEEVPGWRRSVDEVLAMAGASENDAYARSYFFRPGGVRVEGGELLPTRRAPLEPGTKGSVLLHFHNPHLSEADVADLGLELHAPPDALRMDGIDRPPLEGELEVGFEALDGPDPELRIEVSPAPARHTQVLQRLARAGQEHRVQVDGEKEEGDAASPAQRESLRDLYRMIFRKARLDTDDELDVLEAFGELLPGEHEIAEKKALILKGAGRTGEAYDVLAELNREMLGDEVEGVERAPGLHPRAGGEAMSPRIAEAVERVTAVWKDLAELREWRKAADKKRKERLRERLQNRPILIVGRLRNSDWVEHLQDRTYSIIDWCQAYRDDTDDLDSYAERVRKGKYAAVLHYL